MLSTFPSLPKWAEVFITGTSVTPEQAQDIIFRTDTSIQNPGCSYGISGNDERFRDHCFEIFGWRPLIEATDMWHAVTPTHQQYREDFLKSHNQMTPYVIADLWRTEMGMVSPEYITTDLMCSSYIGGPHGWVKPDGTIYASGYNIGKYPSVEEVVDDWKMLVAAFPYLDLVCTVFDGEVTDDVSPVCSIIVKNGSVEAIAPDTTLHTAGQQVVTSETLVDGLQRMLSDSSYSRGWPPGWYYEFAAKSVAAMNRVVPPRITSVNAGILTDAIAKTNLP